MKKGKDYEILIEEVYRKLNIDAIIKRNDKILGYNSKIEREIDLSITKHIANHKILMIVQARDHVKKLDVNDIGEFNSVIEDVKANKGIIISAKGFTRNAIQLAKSLDIDALTGVDIRNPKWSINLKLPVILSTFSGHYRPNFTFVATKEYAHYSKDKSEIKAPYVKDYRVSDDGGKTFKTIETLFYGMIANGLIDSLCDGTEHRVESKSALKLLIVDGITAILKDFKIFFTITRNRYYKYFNIKEFQGLIDQSDFKISRANVRVESEEFDVANYDIIIKKEVDFTTWQAYNDDTKLIYPYKIEVASITLKSPAKINYVFGGQLSDSELESL